MSTLARPVALRAHARLQTSISLTLALGMFAFFLAGEPPIALTLLA